MGDAAVPIGGIESSTDIPLGSVKIQDPKSLIENRKQKLSELFILHHLDRLRTVHTEEHLQPLKDKLSQFLQRNDIEKDLLFDWKVLEDLALVLPSEDTPHENIDKKTDNEETEIIQRNQDDTRQGIRAENAKTSELEQKQEVDVPNHSTEPVNTTSSVNVPNEEEAEESKASATRQVYPKSTSPQSDGSLSPDSTPQSQKIQSTPCTQKTSISSLQQSQDETRLELRPGPPKKKRKSPDGHISLYDPNNKATSDTTVLILKETLPAKVAESTPLAELYYLAQTLPLVKLIPSTHKVVTSNMFESALTEGKINVVNSRIEELKRQGKWSLRQPTRFVDPIKSSQKTQWDYMLSEMNWLATDFKEMRKLRIATCAFIAQCVSEYWKFGTVTCIKRKPIKYLEPEIPDAQFQDAVEDPVESDQPELEDTESIDISKLLKRPNPEEEFVLPKLPEPRLEEYKEYKKNQTPFKLSVETIELKNSEKTLLDNLPTFSSFQQFDDHFETAPLVPVSKVILPAEDENYFNVYFKNLIDESNVIPDQQKGLFGFSSQKKISISIKPPSPPNLKYLDLRTPTIWLPEDDQDLIEYVNLFSFNWGVVSAHLSKRPTKSYSSNIERRTPWQCFERYIQLNDTFQINDMRGSNTLNAMKWLEHAHNIQATTKRRISPLGVGIESIQRGHKRLRWASMFEAIRKCMRKRESVTRPNNNQARKPLDDKKVSAPTPADLSKLKYERDKAIQDAYLQNTAGFRARSNPNVASSRPASGSTPAQGQPAQTSQGQQNRSGTTPGPQGSNPVQPSTNSSNSGVGPSTGSSLTAKPEQSTSIQSKTSQQQALQSNAMRKSVSMSANVQRANIPQGQSPITNPRVVNVTTQAVKSTTGPPTGQPYTPEQLQQLVQMRQRKVMQQQQQQQQQGIGTGSNNGVVSASSSPGLANSQLNVNGATRSNSNPMMPGSQISSPVISQTQSPINQQNKLSSPIVNNAIVNNTNGANNGGRKMTFAPVHVSAVINQIQSKNPNLSKAEVTKMAAHYIASAQAKHNSRVDQVNGNGSPTASSPQINTKSSPVPTPQQILQQQQERSATPSQPASSSQLQQAGPTSVLTPDQKMQLDMLKALHAEQQQKRQQSAKGTGSLTGNNGSGSHNS